MNDVTFSPQSGVYYYYMPWRRFLEAWKKDIKINFGNPAKVPYAVHVVHNFRNPPLGTMASEAAETIQRWPGASVGMFTRGNVLIPLEEGTTIPIGIVDNLTLHLSTPLFLDYIDGARKIMAVDGFVYIIIAPVAYFPAVTAIARRGQQWQLTWPLTDTAEAATNRIIFDPAVYPGFCLNLFKGNPEYRVWEIDRINVNLLATVPVGGMVSYPRICLYVRTTAGIPENIELWRRTLCTNVSATPLVTGKVGDSYSETFDPPIKLLYDRAGEVANECLGHASFWFFRNVALLEFELRVHISGRWQHYGETVPSPVPE